MTTVPTSESTTTTTLDVGEVTSLPTSTTAGAATTAGGGTTTPGVSGIDTGGGGTAGPTAGQWALLVLGFVLVIGLAGSAVFARK